MPTRPPVPPPALRHVPNERRLARRHHETNPVRSAVFVVVVALGGCAAVSTHANGARGLGADEQARLDAIGVRAVDEHGIVGLSIAVARDGVLVYANGFGHVDAARTRAATADTVYDVASVGKQFTAAAILQLVDRGELALHARVRSLVPQLPANFPDATVEQLLRHTSGFVGADLDELQPPAYYTSPKRGLEVLQDPQLVGGEARFAGGETWIYCNPAYVVLGVVVEAVSGMAYADYVRERVLAPIGPHRMTVCEYPPPALGSQRLRRDGDAIAEVPHIDMSAYGGQGAICASVRDLIRWSRAVDEARVFSRESLARFRSPSTVRGAQATASIPYGLGQRLGVLDGHRKAGHSGTFDGGSAALFSYPDDGLEVAVISNTMGAGVPHAVLIEAEIAKLLLGVTPPDVEAQRRPLDNAQRRAIEGSYVGRRRFTATIEGDELVAKKDGVVQERLLHIGGMRFRRVDRPDVHEWFVLDGERAGWWIYSMSGNFLDVLRRDAR